MAIIVPVLSRAKRKARAMLGMNNQRQIVTALNLFAIDNHDVYPPSVATVGFGEKWNWSDPTKLIGNRARSLVLSRAAGAYLSSYLPEADTIYCPSAPRKYKYLQEAWGAGDDWDNPDTPIDSDPLCGTYCLFWNYTGYLGGRRVTFNGPRTPAAGRGRSKLLVTDYFGYNHNRSFGYYTSCEKIKGADIIPETWFLSSVWSRPVDPNKPVPEVKLKAGYVDGHVEDYSTSQAVRMEVSITADGTEPYPDGVGPGVFLLPPAALH